MQGMAHATASKTRHSSAREILDAVGRPGSDFPWQLVLENTVVGISYMQDRRFLWANARMAEIFGYQAGELDGEPVRRLYVTVDDYEDVGRRMASAPQAGFVTHERAMACKSGALIWCRISGRLIHPGDPHSPSVWVVQDLSDKKRAEDELRRVNQRLEQTVERRTINLRRTNEALKAQNERGRSLQMAVVASREKYRTLFRHMPLGVLVVDPEGLITEVNRTLQHYLGATTRARLDELVQDPSRVVLADGSTVSLTALLRARAAAVRPRVERFEFSWIMPSMRRREIASIGAPLATSRQGVVFTFADVTEQHRRRAREHEQQAALVHASRLSLMGQMASALAHELGQPLNASLSYLSGLRHRLGAELAERPELLTALDKATGHLEQAGQIIRNVRSFVSRHQPEFEAVELPLLIDQTIRHLEFPVRSAGVQIEVQADEPGAEALPRVRCNPVEIQQVIVNLLVNAVEAMEHTPAPQRRIVVRLTREPRAMVGIEVTDHGPGVDADLVPRIFDPYVTTKRSGLGMGLMISRTIVESHGGALRYVRHRGSGATFRFTVPAWKEA